MTQLPAWLGPLLWSAYVALPARNWVWLGGVPLSAASAVALAAIWFLWSFRARPWSWRPAAMLIVCKIVVGSALVDRGLVAEYFANDAWRPPVERSVEHPFAAFTRIDSAIDFGARSRVDLPLFFLNDLARFNFYQPNEPNRRALPYSATWNGDLLVSAEGPARMFIRGEGVRADLAIDGYPVVSLAPDQREAHGSVVLRKGWRRLRVTVSGAYGAERALTAGAVDPQGRDRPFDADEVFVRRVSGTRLAADTIARLAGRAIDLLVLLWLARLLIVGTRWRLQAVLWAAALVDAFAFGWPWIGRLMLLDGGSDPLTYEFYARDILLHGPLMTLGDPIGHGTAFYYQPLYPYVLALSHLVFGDGFFGIVLVQRLLVWVTVALVWPTTLALFGPRAGAVGLAAFVPFAAIKLGHWAEVLLGEILFIPIVCAWVLALIHLRRRATAKALAGAGALGGLATLSRSTLLLAWPVALASLLTGDARKAGRGRAVLVFFSAMAIVVAFATVRNWIVAGTFVPLTTSFSINFYLGNEPPKGVPLHPVTAHRFYRWFARVDTTRMAIEFARHAPWLFLRGLWKKMLYTLGFFGALIPGAGWSPLLAMTWPTALVGAVAASRSRQSPEWWLPGAVAMSHWVVVVLIFPNVYGDRLILPFYVLLLPYVACALARTPTVRRARPVAESA